MEIVFFDMVNEKDEKFFKKELKGHKLKFFNESIQKVEIEKFKNAEIIVVFIHSKISKEIMKKLKKLKSVITQSTGFDHIDLKYTIKKKIQVGNVPFYGENTVAEHTFALILNLSRKVHKNYIRTIHDNFSTEGLQGFDLKGKTLGVIGVGQIGLHVIRIAKGFGMHVKAFDLYQDDFLAETLHFNYVDIDEIIKTSDIITLHVPLNRKTFHLIDENKIKKMKKGVHIINTSRGPVIETNALYKYLENNHIGGAGLDVIEGEELFAKKDEFLDKSNNEELIKIFKNKKIFDMENVIFTPHNAFNSIEATQRITTTTLENIQKFTKEGELKHRV